MAAESNTQFVRERGRRSIGSVENTFRFLHQRRSYGKEFIKKEFESLDYDPCENEIYMNNMKQKNFSVVSLDAIRRYINFAIVGILSGILGALVNLCIINLSYVKNHQLAKLIMACKDNNCLYKIYGVWFGYIFGFVFIGMSLVVFIEPGAAGGGIGPIVAYLNGVDVQRTLTLPVILVKFVSMTCVCASGIVGGKEGPMIHIGAALGAVVVMLPVMCHLCQPFRNHREMRDLVAAGVAGGVAAAFGSPVGGFLLSVEESVSFLSISLLFKIYLTSLFSVTSMNYIGSAYSGFQGYIGKKNLLYLGKVGEEDARFTIFEFPAFLLVGVCAGLIGALFVFIQKHMIVFRRKHCSKKWAKMFEGLIVVILTTTTHMAITYLWKECGDYEDPGSSVSLNCKEGQNEISMYTLNSGEECLRWLVHAPNSSISLATAFALFIMYFSLAMYTLGLNMAIGVFVPNLLLGATWGRCLGILFNKCFPNNDWAGETKYTFLAAAAQLSGSLRLTFSITVIMMEVSGNNHLVLPLMLILTVAKWVGDMLTPPLFEAQIILAGMPFLFPHPPSFACEIPVKSIMASPVISLPPVITVGEAVSNIKLHSYQGYPVVDSNNILIGLVLSSQILILMKYKIFLGTDVDLDDLDNIFDREFKKKIDLSSLSLTERDFGQRINLQIIMNPCPYAVRQNMSFDRAYMLFRMVGLRHIIIVDTTYKVVGIVTRKELSKYLAVHDGITKLPII